MIYSLLRKIHSITIVCIHDAEDRWWLLIQPSGELCALLDERNLLHTVYKVHTSMLLVV